MSHITQHRAQVCNWSPRAGRPAMLYTRGDGKGGQLSALTGWFVSDGNKLEIKKLFKPGFTIQLMKYKMRNKYFWICSTSPTFWTEIKSFGFHRSVAGMLVVSWTKTASVSHLVWTLSECKGENIASSWWGAWSIWRQMFNITFPWKCSTF